MSVDDWVALGTDETVLWTGRPRLTLVLPALGVGVGLAAVAAWLSVSIGEPLLLAGVPVGLAIPLVAALRLVNTRFAITTRACYRKDGVLARHVTRISLARIQHSGFRQGIVSARFGYGTVSIEAAGGGKLAFNDIPTPLEVRSLVDEHVEDDGIPGSDEQWRAVLAEVRAIRAAFEEAWPRP